MIEIDGAIEHNAVMNPTSNRMSAGSDDRAGLQALAHDIVSQERERDSLFREVGMLGRLLERLSGVTPDVHVALGANETVTAAGLAISPVKAALCVREPLRTIVFIRGLAAAIEQERRPDRPVRVLYAGCGPLATLALPLMTLFDPDAVSFTLVDIHAASLDSARALVGHLGLETHVAGYVLADACSLRLDPAALPDVIVSETMNAALRSEPQVAIMRHLAMQAPLALLVPESVTVEACLLRLSKELSPPRDDGGAQQAPRRERVELGPVFHLDAAAIRAWSGMDAALPAGAVQVPATVPAGMQPRLLTKIVSFGSHRLQDWESSLNLPQHFPGRPVLQGGETLQFAYRIGEQPGLVLL
jgi:hypothetical protein